MSANFRVDIVTVLYVCDKLPLILRQPGVWKCQMLQERATQRPVFWANYFSNHLVSCHRQHFHHLNYISIVSQEVVRRLMSLSYDYERLTKLP